MQITQKYKDLTEFNPRKSDEEDGVIKPFFGIPLSQIFVSKVYLHLKKHPSRRGGHIGDSIGGVDFGQF